MAGQSSKQFELLRECLQFFHRRGTNVAGIHREGEERWPWGAFGVVGDICAGCRYMASKYRSRQTLCERLVHSSQGGMDDAFNHMTWAVPTLMSIMVHV